MNLDECIFFLLAKCSQTGSRFWAQKVAPLGVTAVQAMVLGFLSEEDLVSSRQLGERTVLDSATLTGILDRLEGVGYIQRRSNPEDRRAIVIGLTAKGKEVADIIRILVEEANREFLAGLSKEEEAMLRGLLKRLKQR
jgi:MarR family transcriptional regulator, organic hydroperoxide resistance regulator